MNLAMLTNNLSMLSPDLAEVSVKYIMLLSFLNYNPYSNDTSLWFSKSLLFPISCKRTSYEHDVLASFNQSYKLSNVSLLVNEYPKIAACAPL
jgi:hypothetical protein